MQLVYKKYFYKYICNSLRIAYVFILPQVLPVTPRSTPTFLVLDSVFCFFSPSFPFILEKENTFIATSQTITYRGSSQVRMLLIGVLVFLYLPVLLTSHVAITTVGRDTVPMLPTPLSSTDNPLSRFVLFEMVAIPTSR